VFNVHTAPPAVPPDCVQGRTEHQVVQRPDDAEDTVRERLRVYEEKTRKPVSGFYSYTGLIRTVDAEGDIEQITKRLLDTLSAGGGTLVSKPAPKRRPVKRRAVPKTAKKARSRKVVRKKVARKKAKAAPKRRPAARKRVAARKSGRKARPTRRASKRR
jgi:adenylate kinase